MILNCYSESELTESFGIDMSSVHGLGVGAGWGRVAPGVSSRTDRHDETEFFVIVAGEGELIVDGRTHHARPGTVALFEPFESHVIANTGQEDLVFFTQYWRDAARAQFSARSRTRPHATGRPQFVFSTPPTPDGDLHIGHLSGPYLGADVYVRYQRLNGNRAWHLTGSDDFQSRAEALADREGATPADIARRYSAEIAAILEAMDIAVDQYHATSVDEGYAEGLRRYFTRLIDSGRVQPEATPGLVDGERRSRLSEATPHRTDLERYTLPLHEFADFVADHHRCGRVPARLRELAQRVFAHDAIDLPLAHPSGWGVRPAEAPVGDQVIRAWPQMSYGLLHGIERLGAELGEDWSRDAPGPDWKIVHFFGYDNSFYRAILYPVLYRLAFPEWNPDIDYHVNEFYLLEGEKFSTGGRHAIWGKELLTPDTVDAVRYYLCRTRPEGQRANFRRTEFDRTVADTLVGQWETWLTGLAERIGRDHGGTVPDAGTWTSEHTAFLARLSVRLEEITAALNPEGFSPRRAAAVLDGIVADAREFAGQQVRLAGLDRWGAEARTATALELAAARLLAGVSAPLMPRFSGRLAAAIGIPEITIWPETVELVPPGSRCAPARARYFTDTARSDAVLEALTADAR